MQEFKGRNSVRAGRGGSSRSGCGRFKKSGPRTSSGAGRSDAPKKYTRNKPTGAKTSGSYSSRGSSRYAGGGHDFGAGIGMMPI